MKKMKKVFAMLLAFAMVMGMSLTTFAAGNANYNNNITINGLAAGDETTINVYQIVYLDETANNWVVAEWAKDYVTTTTNPFTINLAGLEAAASPASVYKTASDVDETTYTFTNLEVGAYLILAAGEKATYTAMVANTYAGTETYMASQAVSIDAKTSGYSVDKAASDNFVYRGETVTFTITTTYPSFADADAQGNSYKLIDTPTDLKNMTLKSVTIGSEDVTAKCSTATAENGDFVIDLSETIGTTNEHAGKTVVAVYTAVVTNDNGYNNIVKAYRNEVELGQDSEAGFTGDITITKKDAADKTTVLNGAEFEVYEGETKLSFVYVSDGVYKLAEAGEEGAVTTLVATNGTVQIKGMDEGTYKFKETKAPLGYSINEEGVTVTMAPAEDDKATADKDESKANVSLADQLLDTKLSALPSTGGIGTAVFTIGGCAIMIAAAYFFFVSRKKEA